VEKIMNTTIIMLVFGWFRFLERIWLLLCWEPSPQWRNYDVCCKQTKMACLFYKLNTHHDNIVISLSFFIAASLFLRFNLYNLDLRRHPRPILRPSRTLQSRGGMSRQKLPLFRRLCRSWLLQCRNLFTAIGPKSPLSGPYHFDSG
jgi:hypothetical protein